MNQYEKPEDSCLTKKQALFLQIRCHNLLNSTFNNLQVIKGKVVEMQVNATFCIPTIPSAQVFYPLLIVEKFRIGPKNNWMK